MKVLIIGGSRFVGPVLLEKLLPNHEITIFNRGKISKKYPKSVKVAFGDRNDGFGIKEAFDVVVDMCAYNGQQTKDALEQLTFDYFLHFGSIAAYKKTEVFPLEEDSAIGKWAYWGDYNTGKVESEIVLKQSGVKYANIRPTYILGPANYCDREHFIYRKLSTGEKLVLPGNGEALVQFTFSYDVAHAIQLLLEHKTTGNYNIAGDEVLSLRGLVEAQANILEVEPRIEFNFQADGLNHNENEFPFANENAVFSNTRIKKLGWRPTPFMVGLQNDFDNFYSAALKRPL